MTDLTKLTNEELRNHLNAYTVEITNENDWDAIEEEIFRRLTPQPVGEPIRRKIMYIIVFINSTKIIEHINRAGTFNSPEEGITWLKENIGIEWHDRLYVIQAWQV